MKIPARLSVTCCTALLIAALPPVARSASNTLALADAEPQYASHLCWASADTLAVNNFYPVCPLPPGTLAPAYFPTSQAVDAGIHAFNVQGPATSTFVPQPLSQLLQDCETDIQAVQCNDFDFPPLRGLTYNKGFPTGTPSATGTDKLGLTWEAAMQEIDNGRPFLFMWNSEVANYAVGAHQLVATGYSDERDPPGTRYLQIWDPWPPPKLPPSNLPPSSVPACGPVAAVPVTGHSQWILFSKYTKPVSDLGVSVAAVHDKDLWNLAKIPVPEPPVISIDGGTPPQPRPLPPTGLHVDFAARLPPPPPPLAELTFAKALATALPQSRQLELQVHGAAPRALGVPFPIVGLRLEQLLRGRNDPTGLLAGTTSAILFPVESQGAVVDAFLMLFIDGRWQRDGYANVEITARLVDVRARYAAQQHLELNSFYMVSVPGEVAFFAAHGKGAQAVLIPASTDPLIGAVAGAAEPADQQLRRLILVVQRDLQRRGSVRPVP